MPLGGKADYLNNTKDLINNTKGQRIQIKPYSIYTKDRRN